MKRVFFLMALTISMNLMAGPWVFFDLGDTLIKKHDKGLYVYTQKSWEYLEWLVKKDYQLGIITNVPVSWGVTNEDRVKVLKDLVDDNWGDKKPMLWKAFKVILTPPKEELKKPHPHLFDKARKQAGSCPPLFYGENLSEVVQATFSGFHSHKVDLRPKQPYFSVSYHRFLYKNRFKHLCKE